MSIAALVQRYFASRQGSDPVDRLYEAIVAQARTPAFYAELGVPDSLDGRFELIALHMFLILRRLKALSSDRAASQALVDRLFADMDANLREMGAGDLGVGRRVKAMAAAFYGRLTAYEAGLAAGTLEPALARNAYGTTSPKEAEVARLAAYVQACDRKLTAQPIARIVEGLVDFPAP